MPLKKVSGHNIKNVSIGINIIIEIYSNLQLIL